MRTLCQRLLPGLAWLAGLAGAAQAAVPDWLQQAQSVAVPGYEDDVDAVHLLHQVEVTVLPDGRQRTVERNAYRILRPGGQGYGVATAHYQVGDQVSRMQGWSIPEGAKPYEAGLRDAIETALVPGTEAALISNARMKVLRVPAANPGSVVGFETEVLSRPEVLGDFWIPQSGIPVVHARYVLRLPRGWTYESRWHNGAAVEPKLRADQAVEWELTHLEPIYAEAYMPTLSAVAASLQIAVRSPNGARSSFREWRDLGLWFQALVDERSVVTPAIVGSAAAHASADLPLLSRIRSLADHVRRDIRYVHVRLDATGHQPRSPAEVLGTGYGDCKDKANYLRVLLQQIGVKSHLVLVQTERGAMDPRQLPARRFDHAVLAIRLPADADLAAMSPAALIEDSAGGRLLLFDPTDESTPFGRVGAHLQQRPVLLVTDEAAHFAQVGADTPEVNGTDRRVEMQLAADGSLRGNVQEVWRGARAREERARIVSAEQAADPKRPIEARLADSVQVYRLGDASVSGRTTIDSPIEWNYSFNAPGYAKVTGQLLLVRPRVVGLKGGSVTRPGKPRRYPVAFDQLRRDQDTMRIELPDGYAVESLPDPVAIDIGFAAYQSSSRVEGRTLIYERRYEQKMLDLPGDRADELQALYEAIDADERSVAVLTRLP